MIVRLVALACLLAWAAPSAAQADARLSAEALAAARHLAIQHRGRLKPFDSFAREALDQLTGAPAREAEDPVITVLSLVTEPERWQEAPLIAIPTVALREALGLAADTTHVSYNALIATRALMRRLPSLVEKQRRNERLTMLDHETWDAYERFVLLNQLFEQDLALVPSATAAEPTWSSIRQPSGHPADAQQRLRESWTAVMMAFRASESEAFADAIGTLRAALVDLNPSVVPARWRLRLEVLYNRLAPFRLAIGLYAAAAALLLLGLLARVSRAASVGLGLMGTALAVHTAGIGCRVVLGGRPPVSNFFETMLWLPYVGVIISLILERLYRARVMAFSAAVLAGITLALAQRVPLDSSIVPVVAVLRSNLWLTVHVLTIVASYGALALATVLAHVHGTLHLARGPSHPALARMELLLYRTIQVGVVLLAGGIMLGAVWANASWGRYWGWDPKETWALITLLWFLAVLHGRMAGWLRGVGTALATIGGFFLLLVTYYGVSFYFVGLHSYAGGHATPLPPLFVAYLIGEAAFLAVVGATALVIRGHNT